jgi:uncharacterized phage infection (PIP) family protein YhgE
MIKSSLKIKKSVEGLLADPEGLKKLIDNLEAQEKKSKAALKALQDGKSKTKFVQECESKVKAAQDKLVELEYKADIILNDAKKKAAAILEEVLLKEAEVSKYAGKVSSEMQSVESLSRSVRSDKAQSTKTLKEAKREKEAYSKARVEYENKLEDLKSRFSGLI